MELSGLVCRLGGKSRLKKEIVNNYFPEDYVCMTYVEPFVGGGSIFFYKNPSVLEVINDLDENIYTIFNGAKKYDNLDIKNRLDGVYTKEQFNIIRDSKLDDEFEKFCRTYYLLKNSILGKGTTWKDDRPKMNVKLEGYKERLEDVVIYNTDYKELIVKYDSPDTFFYLDPPYEESKGLYNHYDINMFEMYSILSKIKGKFLISYNNSENVREIFKNYNIKEVVTKYNSGMYSKGSRAKGSRDVVELLISNY